MGEAVFGKGKKEPCGVIEKGCRILSVSKNKAGISESWQPSDLDSYFNWVRIKNPFRNRDEYYTWSEFEASWASSRSLVEIWKE
jgi:hypothetical protein